MDGEQKNLLPLFLLKQDITRAFVYFTVFLLSSVLVWTAYLNFVLLQPYFPPLFWAVIISIPLHSLKSHILVFVENHFMYGGSLLTLIGVALRVSLKLLAGPVWVVLEYSMSGYFALHIHPYSTKDFCKVVEAQVQNDSNFRTRIFQGFFSPRSRFRPRGACCASIYKQLS